MSETATHEFYLRLNTLKFDHETGNVNFDFDCIDKLSPIGNIAITVKKQDIDNSDMDLIMARGWQTLRHALIQMTDEAKAHTVAHLDHVPEGKR